MCNREMVLNRSESNIWNWVLQAGPIEYKDLDKFQYEFQVRIMTPYNDNKSIHQNDDLHFD